MPQLEINEVVLVHCNIVGINMKQNQHTKYSTNNPLPKKCPYSELFWPKFSRIRTEHEEIWSISPYSARIRGNADQNNSEYGYFYAVNHIYSEIFHSVSIYRSMVYRSKFRVSRDRGQKKFNSGYQWCK